jgi:hypothetical protein
MLNLAFSRLFENAVFQLGSFRPDLLSRTSLRPRSIDEQPFVSFGGHREKQTGSVISLRTLNDASIKVASVICVAGGDKSGQIVPNKNHYTF